MPTASVKPYLPEERVRRRLPFDLWVPVALLVAVVAVAVLASALRSGPFVSQVRFTNSGHYAYEVSVAGSSTSATTLLGNAGAKATTKVDSVFDQGANWTFRFETQGHFAGVVVMSRSELEQSRWLVVIPDRFAQALSDAGVVPTD